jgi:hypothetical protein
MAHLYSGIRARIFGQIRKLLSETTYRRGGSLGVNFAKGLAGTIRGRPASKQPSGKGSNAASALVQQAEAHLDQQIRADQCAVEVDGQRRLVCEWQPLSIVPRDVGAMRCLFCHRQG